MESSTLTLREYDIRGASEREYAALHAFFRRIESEERPDDPPESLEHFIALRRHFPDFVDGNAFALWAGDTVVGEAGVFTTNTEDNQHLADFSVWVLPEYRRQGLGRRLLATIAEVAVRKQRRLLVGFTSSGIPAGEAFMQRLGASRGLETHLNQLVLADLDRDLLRRWIERGESLAGEFELGLWDGPYPEEEIEAIVRLWEVMNTAPRDLLDVEDFQMSPALLREMEASLWGRGMQRWSLYVRERATGTLAGFTEVVWEPSRAEILQQADTAVVPAYRNRGLGRWLKAAMLEKVLRERRQVKLVRTGNADSNAPMLKINHELGFKPYLAGTVWQIETEKVLEYLRGHAG